MKNKFILIAVLIISCSTDIYGQGKVNFYYINNQNEQIILGGESYYDIEEKPKTFFLSDTNKNETDIYIIEIYRLINSAKEDKSSEFYKSFALTSDKISQGFNISGVFSDIQTPFIISYGFVIRLCKTSQKNYLRLKSRDQCRLTTEVSVLTGT